MGSASIHSRVGETKKHTRGATTILDLTPGGRDTDWYPSLEFGPTR